MSPRIQRVRQLFLAAGAIRFAHFDEAIPLIKTNGTLVLLKNPETEFRLSFFCFVEQFGPCSTTDISGQAIEVVQPPISRCAEANQAVVLLGAPHLALSENDIAEICDVFLNAVEVWKIG
ncbi:hypothetical protein ASF03_14395 [Rhizobium sp. Leaf68]|nr:hypothetical protein ASE62_19595 [Rhizobium sp. Leaf202]KQN83170.1 hypothetical protein ASF03_14395 [Rhizobium sp. Leaf68]